MSDFLFVTWDGGGNVPPALGIAAELASRGHGVRFLGHEGNREAVTNRGLSFAPYENALPFSSRELNPPERMAEIFNDAGIAADMLEHARRTPTDVVVIDCLMLNALATAQAEGLTYVPLEHLFDHYLREYWVRGPWGGVAEARGYSPLVALDAAPLTLVATLAQLDPAAKGPTPENLVFTGPVLSASAPRELSSLEPNILVSLSTYNFPGQTESMQQILEAVDGLPAKVVVTTGPVIDGAALRVPANAELHGYVDHDLLMPEATLVIGHGGHATSMRALAHDLPLLVMPQHPMLDQTMVGSAVQEAGAGRLLAQETTADEIRPVIEELLAVGPHRAAAARLGELIRSAHGAATAADELLGVVKNGVPRG
ncbi:MAG TPA: nucleotide disphospho-sugar-binding domain-containing protein [Nocardioidaceae bacterium]|nr:nucleotide disphospho-sugar-binding domain-containing protein [Nocardioidaceae bacterium]